MPAEIESSRRDVLASLAKAQKSNRGAGGYSRWVNRPVGRQFAALAYLAGRTPNQISLMSAGFTMPAIVAVACLRSTSYLGVVVTLALLIGYALDSADGQVARLQGSGSPAGEWLDHVLDAGKVSTFHVAIAIAWYRFFNLHHVSLVLIPLGFGIVSAVFFFAITLSDMLRRIERLKSGGTGVTTASLDPYERAPVIRSLVVLPNDYGVLCLSLLLIGQHTAFIGVYTVLFIANVFFLAAGCARWFREMRSLAR